MNAPLFLAENKQDIDQAKYTACNELKGSDTFLGRNKE